MRELCYRKLLANAPVAIKPWPVGYTKTRTKILLELISGLNLIPLIIKCVIRRLLGFGHSNHQSERDPWPIIRQRPEPEAAQGIDPSRRPAQEYDSRSRSRWRDVSAYITTQHTLLRHSWRNCIFNGTYSTPYIYTNVCWWPIILQR